MGITNTRILWARSSRTRWNAASVLLVAAAVVAAVTGLDVAATMASGDRIILFAMLVQGLFALVAGILLYLTWRIHPVAATGWLSAALIFLGLQNLPFLLAAYANPGLSTSTGGEGIEVVVGCYLAVLASRACRGTERVRPMLLGIGGAAGVIGVRVLMVQTNSIPRGLVEGTALSERLVVLFLALFTLVAVLRTSAFSIHTRVLLSIVVLGIGVERAVDTARGSAAGWGSASMTAVVVIGLGLLLLDVAIRTLLDALSDHQAHMETLALRAVESEARARLGDDLLHEVRSTVGGLSTASTLLARPSGLSEAHRSRLQHAVTDELLRVNRSLYTPPTSIQEFDLTTVVDQVVDLYRAAGCEILWTGPESSGQARTLHVRHVPDQVAQAIGTLLHNAVRHAPGRTVQITCRNVGEFVLLDVSQPGPEVDPSIRDDLFQRGVHSTTQGQGIGLYVARAMMRGSDGDLRLSITGPALTTFTLQLPVPRP